MEHSIQFEHMVSTLENIKKMFDRDLSIDVEKINLDMTELHRAAEEISEAMERMNESMPEVWRALKEALEINKSLPEMLKRSYTPHISVSHIRR